LDIWSQAGALTPFMKLRAFADHRRGSVLLVWFHIPVHGTVSEQCVRDEVKGLDVVLCGHVSLCPVGGWHEMEQVALLQR
jgi:hypothetical protein